MRPIGAIQNEILALRFGGFLSSRGIDNQVDNNSRGAWEVWILDDDNIEKAKSLLDRFHQNPDDPTYAEAVKAAARQQQQQEAAYAPKRNRVIDASAIFYVPPVALGRLSVVLIAISVLVTLLTTFGGDDRLRQILSIAEFGVSSNGEAAPQEWLPEVRQGQVWRLFTPMFLHFGILHIVFNMLWLRDLGSMIETRRGPWMLLVLTLVLAGTSNLAQYTVTGPSFGGMSGVVYGLLGYVWMQGKYNPASGLALHPQTVTFMLVWFFLCLSGLMGPIANTAHAVGLAVGTTWGFLAARLPAMLRRN